MRDKAYIYAQKLKNLRRRLIMFCTKCGSNYPEGSGFCPKCGVAVRKESDITPPTTHINTTTMKKAIAGISIVILVFVVFFATRGDSADSSRANANRGGGSSQTIRFSGLEVAVTEGQVLRHGDLLGVQERILIFVNVSNTGNAPNTLQLSDISIFGPNGNQILPVDERVGNSIMNNNRGNILPGGSQELVIIIPIPGAGGFGSRDIAGDYTIFFHPAEQQVAVPISRNNSPISEGIVGNWRIDSSQSNGVLYRHEITGITFDEDGTGTIYMYCVWNGPNTPINITWFADATTVHGENRLTIIVGTHRYTFVSIPSRVGNRLYFDDTSRHNRNTQPGREYTCVFIQN